MLGFAQKEAAERQFGKPSIIELFAMWREDRRLIDIMNRRDPLVLRLLLREVVETEEEIPKLDFRDKDSVCRFTSEVADIFAFTLSLLENNSNPSRLILRELHAYNGHGESELDLLEKKWMAEHVVMADVMQTIRMSVVRIRQRAVSIQAKIEHIEQLKNSGQTEHIWAVKQALKPELVAMLGECAGVIRLCGHDPQETLEAKVAFNIIQYSAEGMRGKPGYNYTDEELFAEYEQARTAQKEFAKERGLREEFYGYPRVKYVRSGTPQVEVAEVPPQTELAFPVSVSPSSVTGFPLSPLR
jgi:hypothetical protein